MASTGNGYTSIESLFPIGGAGIGCQEISNRYSNCTSIYDNSNYYDCDDGEDEYYNYELDSQSSDHWLNVVPSYDT